jgi:transposase-like protein
MSEHLGGASYERAEGRTGRRNGHKPRTSRVQGPHPEPASPKDREGTFSTRLFARYQRNEKRSVW